METGTGKLSGSLLRAVFTIIFLLCFVPLSLSRDSSFHIGHSTTEIEVGKATLTLHSIIATNTEPIVDHLIPKDVLLLHGAKFSSKTWESSGTVKLLCNEGFRVFAVDLPDFGLSSLTSSNNIDPKPEEILDKIIVTLGIKKPIIVSPSMSGRFSLPFLLSHPEKVGGFVPVAPTLPPRFDAASVKASTFPTLVVWGSNDTAGRERSKCFSSFSGRVELFEMTRANHACYLDDPDAFHKRLIEFLKSI